MKNVVLIVEDAEMNREILRNLLVRDYRVIEARDGVEALEALESWGDAIAVVLLDLHMPRMSGFEVLETMNDRGLTKRYPVLVVTGETGPEVEEQCLVMGACDFIRKPFVPALVRHRVRNAASLYSYKLQLEDQVAIQTAQLLRQADDLRKKNLRLREINEKTIELLSDIAESRNLENGTHVHRVRCFTRILAEKLMEKYPEYGLTEQSVGYISLASSMHDVGKIMITDTILLKPGNLTAEEFTLMQKHTIFGCIVLDRTRFMWETDYSRYCRQICRHHHEKWDGRGYPDGLKGDEIPISAQLVSVADCFDALTTDRVYNKACSPEKAFEMILGGECGEFNPKLMACLNECRAEFSAQVRVIQ